MNRESLKFYFIRLKRASLAEWLHRLQERLLLTAIRRMPRLIGRWVRSPERTPDAATAIQFPDMDGSLDPDVISRIIGGKVYSLNHSPEGLRAFETQWAGHIFPKIPSAASSPDIRAVWEPARLQHLTVLLHRLRSLPQGAEADALQQAVRGDVLDWVARNPFPYGVHYLSVMECGLRIPVFLLCLRTLDRLTADDRRRLFQTIYEHAWLIAHRLSLYSSLGNHTVAECVGLIVAGALFQDTSAGRNWLHTGVRYLEQEAVHQILDDGGPVEQSLDYHRFVLDLFWFAVDFLTRNGLHDCTAIETRLRRGEDFWGAFEIRSGVTPSIGDSDGGAAVAPGLHPRIRAACSESLSGGPEQGASVRKAADDHGSVAVFSQSGYTVIRSRTGVLFTMDHGPLGMPPLFNHGHADPLSVTLSVDERPILVDPGTFRYNGVPAWRRYFKSARAHNTVTVDESDPAVQVTGFIWADPYPVELLASEPYGRNWIIRAVHDGYARPPDQLRHHRTVLAVRHANFLIQDTFSGTGNHAFELNYHLHPGLEARLDGAWWRLEQDGRTVRIRLLSGDGLSCVAGDDGPSKGWYSPAYGVKEKSKVLYCTKTGSADAVRFITAICTDESGNEAWIEEALSSL